MVYLLETLIRYCGDESSAKILAERLTTHPTIKGLWQDVRVAKKLILSKCKITKASGNEYLENHHLSTHVHHRQKDMGLV